MAFIQRLPLLLLFLFGCGNAPIVSDVDYSYETTSYVNGRLTVHINGIGEQDPENYVKTNNGDGTWDYEISGTALAVPQGTHTGSILITHGAGTGLVSEIAIDTFTVVVDGNGDATVTYGGLIDGGGVSAP